MRINKPLFCLFGAIGSTFILNYFFHIYAGRALGPVKYGLYSSLYMFIFIISKPSGGLFQGLTRYFSITSAEKSYERITAATKTISRRIIVSGILVSIILFTVNIFSKTLSNSYALLVSFTALLAWLSPVFLSLIQSLQRFYLLALNIFISHLIGKLIIPLILISLGAGVAGALLGSTSQFLLTIILAAPVLSYIFSKSSFKNTDNLDPLLGRFIFITCTISVIWAAITRSDIIIMRLFFDQLTIGYYSAASLLSKTVISLLMPVFLYFTPQIAFNSHENNVPVKLIKKTVLYCSILIFVSSVFNLLCSDILTEVIFGESYIEGTPRILKMLSLALLPVYFSSVIINILISLGRVDFFKNIFFAFCIQLILLIIFHSSVEQFILMLFLSGIIILSMLFYRINRILKAN